MTQEMSTMERMRADLIRRARVERHGEMTQTANDTELANQHPPTQDTSGGQASRFPLGRPTIPRFFRRRQDRESGGNGSESPKTPDFNLRTPSLPTTRLDLPNLGRTWTARSNGPSSQSDMTQLGSSSPLLSQGSRENFIARPAPASVAPSQSASQQHIRSGRFNSPDPAEAQLAALVEDGRRRRGARQRTHDRGRPRRFMFCFPWIRSRRIRSQILRCFVSGSLLILLLTIYLALSMSKNINSSEMTIMLILVILFGTVFFCHGLIRLVILIVRGDREQRHRSRLPHMYGPGGYAVPSRPIPVVLARDEEAAGVESEAAKAMPPAYGLWRESVRVDPNRLFWQRTAAAEPMPTRQEGHVGPRPPSYISEDGVSYVVEAVPRSTVPTTDVPLPPHPSEVGRGAAMPPP